MEGRSGRIGERIGIRASYPAGVELRKGVRGQRGGDTDLVMIHYDASKWWRVILKSLPTRRVVQCRPPRRVAVADARSMRGGSKTKIGPG